MQSLLILELQHYTQLCTAEVHAGDEVIIPPLTVISNVDVVFAQHGVPVFCDVGPDTWNMSPEKQRH